MTIWILALVLLGCLGFAGYSFGVIRAGFTFFGLVAGSILAFPLGRMMNSPLGMLGLKNPFFIWVTGAFIMFVLVLIVFKIIGFAVHRKVDVHYKYAAGDLRMGLWNRLNACLGLAVGLINGAVYVILISLAIYVFSYATNQMVIGDNAATSVKILNMLGHDVHSSGMAKVVVGIDPMPDSYYDALDIVGMIYHNDLLEARLGRYPAFLSLAQRPQFQDIANDKDFTELRQKQPSFADIINHPKAQAILGNPDFLKEIWSITQPNLKDLAAFLRTGLSATFDTEPILGRWTFNLNGALNEAKKVRANMNANQLTQLKRVLVAAYSKTTLIAAPDKQVFVKNFGTVKPAAKPNTRPTVEFQSLQGQWAGESGKYQITIGGKPQLDAVVEGQKLTVTGDAIPMVFDKEY